jgi:hypothetical protein
MAHRMRLTALITSEPLLKDADAPMGLMICVAYFQHTVARPIALDGHLCIGGLELLDPRQRLVEEFCFEEFCVRIDHWRTARLSGKSDQCGKCPNKAHPFSALSGAMMEATDVRRGARSPVAEKRHPGHIVPIATTAASRPQRRRSSYPPRIVDTC